MVASHPTWGPAAPHLPLHHPARPSAAPAASASHWPAPAAAAPRPPRAGLGSLSSTLPHRHGPHGRPATHTGRGKFETRRQERRAQLDGTHHKGGRTSLSLAGRLSPCDRPASSSCAWPRFSANESPLSSFFRYMGGMQWPSDKQQRDVIQGKQQEPGRAVIPHPSPVPNQPPPAAALPQTHAAQGRRPPPAPLPAAGPAAGEAAGTARGHRTGQSGLTVGRPAAGEAGEGEGEARRSLRLRL